VIGQSTSKPSSDAARKSMSAKRGDERPQKFAFPPVTFTRSHSYSVPGPVVYGMSCSQRPSVYSFSSW
jgi:hypothetical protein